MFCLTSWFQCFNPVYTEHCYIIGTVLSSVIVNKELRFTLSGSVVSLLSCQVSEMAVSELPGNPNAVWTVRRHIEGKRPFPRGLSEGPGATDSRSLRGCIQQRVVHGSSDLAAVAASTSHKGKSHNVCLCD